MDKNNTSDIVQIDLLKGLAIISVIIGHIVAYQAVVTDPQVLLNGAGQIINSSTIQMNFDLANSITPQSFYKIFSHWITYSALLTQQVVPLFIIIMSFNLSLSYFRRGYSKLSQFYSLIEMKKKFRRYFTPYIIIFFISLILGGIYFIITSHQIMVLNFRLFLGYLPINGPGNYFISLMIQMVLFFPILYLGVRTL